MDDNVELTQRFYSAMHNLEGLDAKADLERERDQALVALELAGTAVVISDPG